MTDKETLCKCHFPVSSFLFIQVRINLSMKAKTTIRKAIIIPQSQRFPYCRYLDEITRQQILIDRAHHH
jgi:hypothetical protein